MKIKRVHDTMTNELEELLEKNDWTLVITEKLTGVYVRIEGEGFLSLGYERPTEKQAIDALKREMLKDGYFG